MILISYHPEGKTYQAAEAKLEALLCPGGD